MFVAQTRKRTNEERRRMEFLKIHILHQDGVAALRNHHWIPGRVVSQQLAAAVGSREPAFFFRPAVLRLLADAPAPGALGR